MTPEHRPTPSFPKGARVRSLETGRERTMIWFECVQVVSRNDDGSLKEWFEGEKRGRLHEAKKEQKGLCSEFPGTEYAVIEHEHRMVEIGKAKIG